MKTVLRATGLMKVYGGHSHTHTESCASAGTQTKGFTALQDVGLEVVRGQALGIIGESGSGKTTLVKLLSLQEQPTAGHVVFNDGPQQYNFQSLDGAERRWLTDNRMGIVHQDPRKVLREELSAGANIAERLLVSGERSYSHVRETAARLLTRVGVPAARMDAPLSTYSGGMRQRVQIARALATEPPLLFLDEVTTGLDASVQARVLDLIMELQQTHDVAMVIVTHDLGVARLLCTRAIVMRAGHVVEAGLIDQLLEDPCHAYTQELVAAAL